MPDNLPQPKAGEYLVGSHRLDYPTPSPDDKLLTDFLANDAADYEARLAGQPHPDYPNQPGMRMVRQSPINWQLVQRIYAKDREPIEDTYNASIAYDQESASHPEFTRDYLVRRSELSEFLEARTSTLTGVTNIRVTAGGSGYSQSTVTVTHSGGAGSGLTATAFVSNGVVVGIAITNEGSGYTSAPTITINGGAGATAVAEIQPTTAILVSENVIRAPDSPTDSLYVIVRRVYQTVPGATVYKRETLKAGFLAVTEEQRVLATTMPDAGEFVLSGQIVPENSVTAKRISKLVKLTNGNTPSPGSTPIFVSVRLDDRYRVYRTRYEQKQPFDTAVPPVFDAQYGNGELWAPNTVASLTVSAAGSGYTSIPTITIAAPPGTSSPVTATATARLKVVSAAFAAAGTGYAVNDLLTVGGGTSTTAAVLQVAGFGIATAAIDDPGTGYAPDDLITVTGTGSVTNAVFEVTTTLAVSLTLDDPGTGYVANEIVTLDSTTGNTTTPVTIEVLTVGGGGEVLTWSFTDPGSFTENGTAFTQASTTGAGTGVTFSASVYGVDTFTITTRGAFTSAPAALTQVSVLPNNGTGATFDTVTLGDELQVAVQTAGVYSALPTNPVSITGGTGSGATFTLNWGVQGGVITNAGNGYWSQFPAVTVSGGGGTGAVLIAIVGSYGWRSEPAYIIDGGLDDVEGETNKLKWWVTVPIPPEDKSHVPAPFTFPALFTFPRYPSYWTTASPSPGYDYTLLPSRSGQWPGLHIINYQIGMWSDLPPIYEVLSPGNVSRQFPIPPNCIHPAFDVVEWSGGDITNAEIFPASVPASYTIGQIVVAKCWQERVFGNIWAKHVVYVAERFIDGSFSGLSYDNNSVSGGAYGPPPLSR